MREHSEYVGSCCGAEIRSETPVMKCPKCGKTHPVQWPADYEPESVGEVVEA